MKYVIVQMEGATPRVYAFTFSELLTHSEVARWVTRAVERQFHHRAHACSAGFCETNAYGLYVSKHGSESMGIETDPAQEVKDTAILNMPRHAEGALSYVE